MNTLVVSYLPRGERSHTRKLLNAFTGAINGHEYKHLDLLVSVPDMFMPKNLMAYIKRNYLGESLDDDDAQSLENMDALTAQFKTADVVVMAFPMFNFSFPAVVKAYFDAVMLKGETWDAGDGGYYGLMKGKKALVLFASGADYTGDMAPYDHVSTLARVEFGFMGFEDVRVVTAGGMNVNPDQVDRIVEKAGVQITDIVREWYV